MRIALCAGEASGDKLGASLILELRKIFPNAQFLGVAGQFMQEAGCANIFSTEKISVMGFSAVIRQLPRLLALRKKACRELIAWQPDIFIGIDAPDFNSYLEKKLKEHNVTTVRYVSPTIWAWRQGRIKNMRRHLDLVLSLFPFEKEFYDKYDMPCIYVGHPLADELSTLPGIEKSRALLGLKEESQIIALLPGSRFSEIEYLAPIYLETVKLLLHCHPELQFVLPAANKELMLLLNSMVDRENLPIKVILQNARLAIASADVALVTSGTATLETMILETPMVVGYKTSPLNWWLVKKLVSVNYCSLPNLLADKPLVSEYLQENATAENLSNSLLELLANNELALAMKKEFKSLKSKLTCNASFNAAKAIKELLINNE